MQKEIKSTRYQNKILNILVGTRSLSSDKFDCSTAQNTLKLQVPGIMIVGGLKTVLALATYKQLVMYNAHPSLLFSKVTEWSKIENKKDSFNITPDNIATDKVVDFLSR
ncbi:hypothetical protein [Segetibacter koreensis]|uniref:hypothetical protein n=1 Tax=Segetibacter koreensis TaxID=398037 RepID=UPI0003639422|nr:hypothetical protein [Segetibacter koreensis]